MRPEAGMLRRRFLDELPAIQSLVEMSAPKEVIGTFDEVARCGNSIAAGMQVALYFKVDGKRNPSSIENVLNKLDRLLSLLNTARDILREEQLLR